MIQAAVCRRKCAVRGSFSHDVITEMSPALPNDASLIGAHRVGEGGAKNVCLTGTEALTFRIVDTIYAGAQGTRAAVCQCDVLD
jgi:hypothetical protein